MTAVKNFDHMFSHFDTIQECHRQTNGIVASSAWKELNCYAVIL